MELRRDEVLQFLEADLSRREARFRHRVTLLVLLATVALASWQYSLAATPGPTFRDFMLALGLGSILYVAAGGAIIRRIRRLIHPPALPSDVTPHSLALGIRMLEAYGVGASARAAILLEAGTRATLATICFLAWFEFSIVPWWLGLPVAVSLAAGAVVALALAMLTMASLRSWWRWLRSTLRFGEEPATPPASEVTAKAIEDTLREVLYQAERILPTQLWRVVISLANHVAAIYHYAVLVLAAVIVGILVTAWEPGETATSLAIQLAPPLLAILVSIWVLRETVAVISANDRALIQQLLVTALVGDRELKTIVELYAMIALAHEEDLVIPDKLGQIVNDLKLDSNPLSG